MTTPLESMAPALAYQAGIDYALREIEAEIAWRTSTSTAWTEHNAVALIALRAVRDRILASARLAQQADEAVPDG